MEPGSPCSDKEDELHAGGAPDSEEDPEGSPFQRTFSNHKVERSPAEREQVAARLVRIAAQCQGKPLSAAACAAGEEQEASEMEDAACIEPIMAPADPGKAQETVIIFDWDDTLLPTWYITEVVKPALEDSAQSPLAEALKVSPGRAVSSRSSIVIPPDSEFAEALTEHARKVKVLLQTACAVGKVGIVTLAQRPWVITSAKRFLLGVDFEELIKELKIPIVYARESIKRSMVSLAEAEEGVNVFAVAKQRAMAKVLKKLYGKDLGAWRNVISVGDSRIEKDAMKELLWSIELPEIDLAPPTCKTVKLMEEPSIEQLSAELILLRLWLLPMASYCEDFDIIMDDSEETMLRLHECFCSSSTNPAVYT